MPYWAMGETASSSEGEDLEILTPNSDASLSPRDAESDWLFRGSLLNDPAYCLNQSSGTAVAVHRGRLWCAWIHTGDTCSPIHWSCLDINGVWGRARQVVASCGHHNAAIDAHGTPAIADLNGVLHMVTPEKSDIQIPARDPKKFPRSLVHLQYDDTSETWGKRAFLGLNAIDDPKLMGYMGQLVCVYQSRGLELKYLTWDDVTGWSHSTNVPGANSRSNSFALCIVDESLQLLIDENNYKTSHIRSLSYDSDRCRWLPCKPFATSETTGYGFGASSTRSQVFVVYRDGNDHMLFNASPAGRLKTSQLVHRRHCWNIPAIATLNGTIFCIWQGGPSDGRELMWSQRLARNLVPMDAWMSGISSDLYLSELSIPGSHESCATIQLPWVQCQHLSIEEQLNAGVRYFDFRLGVSFGKLYLFHGRSPLGLLFEDVLAKMYAWLDRGTEAVMLQVKMEGGTGDESVFETLITAEFTVNAKYWALGTAIPKLGAVRGKIQLMRRFHSSGAFGVDVRRWADNSPNFTIPLRGNEGLVVQDRYEFTDVVPTFSELINTKLGAIHALILSARRDENCQTWYLNWCNAYALPLSLGVIATPSDIAIGRNDFGYGRRRRFIPGVNSSLFKASFSTPTKGRFGTILLDYAETPIPDLVGSIVMTNTFI